MFFKYDFLDFSMAKKKRNDVKRELGSIIDSFPDKYVKEIQGLCGDLTDVSPIATLGTSHYKHLSGEIENTVESYGHTLHFGTYDNGFWIGVDAPGDKLEKDSTLVKKLIELPNILTTHTNKPEFGRYISTGKLKPGNDKDPFAIVYFKMNSNRLIDDVDMFRDSLMKTLRTYYLKFLKDNS